MFRAVAVFVPFCVLAACSQSFNVRAARELRKDHIWYSVPFKISGELSWHKNYIELEFRVLPTGYTQVAVYYVCSGSSSGERMQCADQCPTRGAGTLLLKDPASGATTKIPLTCKFSPNDPDEGYSPDYHDYLEAKVESGSLVRFLGPASRIQVLLNGPWYWDELNHGEVDAAGTDALRAYLKKHHTAEPLTFLGARYGCREASDCAPNQQCLDSWCLPTPSDGTVHLCSEGCDIDQVCVRGTCIATW